MLVLRILELRDARILPENANIAVTHACVCFLFSDTCGECAILSYLCEFWIRKVRGYLIPNCETLSTYKYLT